MSDTFTGLDKLQEIKNKLKGVNRFVIRHDNPDLKIDGDTIYAPPEMEPMLSYLLASAVDF